MLLKVSLVRALLTIALLFQPLQTPNLIGKDEIASCLKPLLTVIRHLSQTSALVALIVG